VIDSVSRRQSKMWDFGAELVHPPTLCPNSDAVMIVEFAHRLGQRDTVSEALKVAREIKRLAMSGAQSAPALENRQRIHGTHKNGTNLGVAWRHHIEAGRRITYFNQIRPGIGSNSRCGVNPVDWKVSQGYLKQLGANRATSTLNNEERVYSKLIESLTYLK
jgi:hypothetical protein